MEIVPCTVDQEVKERKKNPDFVLPLIRIDDRPSAEPIDQSSCGDCPTGKANLQYTNYILVEQRPPWPVFSSCGRINATDN